MKDPFKLKKKSGAADKGQKRSLLSVTNIPTAVLFVLFGLALLIWPSLSSRIFGMALAAVLVLCGVYYIVTYFRTDRFLAFTRQDLTLGLVTLAGGIVLFCIPEIPGNVLPYIWCAALLIGGCAKAQTALDMFRLGAKNWWHSLIGAATAIALGVVALWNPFETELVMLRFVGGGLLAEGLMDGYCWFIFDKLRKSLNARVE